MRYQDININNSKIRLKQLWEIIKAGKAPGGLGSDIYQIKIVSSKLEDIYVYESKNNLEVE